MLDDGFRFRAVEFRQQLVDPLLVRSAMAANSDRPVGVRRTRKSGGPRPMAWRATSLSATSRSTMPVTLPFETISMRDNSVMVMPSLLARQRRQHVELRQRERELHAQALAQLRLDRARGAQAAAATAAAAACSSGRARCARRDLGWPSLIAGLRRDRDGLAVDRAAAGEHSHSTVCATSSGVIRRPCALSLASSARASAAERPVLAAILSTAASSSGVSV